MCFLLKIKWLLFNYLLSKPRSFYCHSIIWYLYDKQLTAIIYNLLLPIFSINKRTLFFYSKQLFYQRTVLFSFLSILVLNVKFCSEMLLPKHPQDVIIAKRNKLPMFTCCKIRNTLCYEPWFLFIVHFNQRS